MTLPTETIRNDYTGNGSAVTYPYTFKAFATAQIEVILTDDDGVETVQTNPTHYSLTGVGSASGGNVVFVTAPPTPSDPTRKNVTIKATAAFTQTTDLVNETGFFQDRIETALDRSVRQAQILNERSTRSLQLPEGEAGSETLTVLPPLAERKGRTMAFDSVTGQPVMFSTASTAVSVAMEPVLQADTLALARAAMGTVTAANVVKDFGADNTGTTNATAAIQAAIDSGARRIYLPAGTYLVTTLRLPHSAAYYSPDTGIEIFGDGPWTTITRGEDQADDVVTYASEATYETECAMAVHSSHHRIHDMQFINCANAIYFGHYPGEAADSHCSLSRLWNLLIKDCGTGIHMACSAGCYFNAFENTHVTQCQIGIHMRAGDTWGSTTANNNRNYFKNIRTSRCYVGLLVKNGDTNTFEACHAEGCDGVPTGNRYALPSSILPAAVTAPIGHVFDDQSSNNNAFGCVMESCDFTLYNNGDYNSFHGCLYRENETSPQRVIFVKKPSALTTRDSIIFKTLTRIINARTDVYAGYPAARWVFDEQPLFVGGYESKVSSGGSTKIVERLVDAGLLGSGASVNVTIQADDGSKSLTSGSGVIEVVIVGNCQASNLVHAKHAKIVYLRNSSRTLTRYYIYDEVAGRGTGAGSGDTSEPFVLALSVSGKDLVLGITAPESVFAGVTVVIRELRMV